MRSTLVQISAIATLLLAWVVLHFVNVWTEQRSRHRFDAVYEANLRRRRPDLKL
jgi:peptidoglycan/LPS O-acetylase OafA/YrhL